MGKSTVEIYTDRLQYGEVELGIAIGDTISMNVSTGVGVFEISGDIVPDAPRCRIMIGPGGAVAFEPVDIEPVVVSLADARNARERPDADCMRKDDFGRTLYCYTLSWHRDGHQYGIELWAYSMEDAGAHVQAMRESLALDGQIYSVIPV